MIRDVPIIWRKQSGDIVKGSFCEMEGEWYWSKVATCGVKSDLKERKKTESKTEKYIDCITFWKELIIVALIFVEL